LRWRRIYRAPSWPPDTALSFTDQSHGWAVSSIEEQGFPSQAVHRTDDGARSWTSVRFPVLPTAFAGAGEAWGGSDSDGSLWRTTSAGRSWSVVDRPAFLSPVAPLIATRSIVEVDTAAGELASSDGGRTWRATPVPSPASTARALGQIGYIRSVSNPAGYDCGAPEITRNGGRTWERIPVPAQLMIGSSNEIGDIAFTDFAHGLLTGSDDCSSADLPVYATQNAGRSWRPVPVPRGVPQLGYVIPVALAPGVVVIQGSVRLWVSVDAGRHWMNTPYGDVSSAECRVSRPQPATIWIVCTPVTPGMTLLLRSTDAGASWHEVTTSHPLGPHIVATSATDAWAVEEPAIAAPVLWHTTNGGATWETVWPTTPGETTVAPNSSWGPVGGAWGPPRTAH
jgi:photosystem II stability/assembly factor-like uncharacterized protein